MRASWWNALFSLIVSVCAAHLAAGIALVTAAELAGDVAELPGPRLVLGGLAGLVSLLVQGRMIPWLRVGLGGGISSVPLAASSVVAGLVVWAALLPTGAGVLPLVRR